MNLKLKFFYETLVVINKDNGRQLDFQGSNRLTYLDVASGRACLTVCMRILGGQSARIKRTLVIFQNPNGNYSISVIPDTTDVIIYRSSPNGCMTAQKFVSYLSIRALFSLQTTPGSELFGLIFAAFITSLLSLSKHCGYHVLSRKDFKQNVHLLHNR